MEELSSNGDGGRQQGEQRWDESAGSVSAKCLCKIQLDVAAFLPESVVKGRQLNHLMQCRHWEVKPT